MEIVRQYISDRISIEDHGHDSACWIWKRCRRDGYGRADIGGIAYQSHRVSYGAHVGPIPDGLELDHLCCITNCVNPDHLEPVTGEENRRRMRERRGYRTISRTKKPRKSIPSQPKLPPIPPTRCRRGHPYILEQWPVRVSGKLRCPVCLKKERENHARYMRERRAAARKLGRGESCEQRLVTHNYSGSKRAARGGL